MDFDILISFLVFALLNLIVIIQSTLKIGKPFTNHYFILSKDDKTKLNLDSIFNEARKQSISIFITFGVVAPILYLLNVSYFILIAFIIPFCILSNKWYIETEKDLDKQRKELRSK